MDSKYHAHVNSKQIEERHRQHYEELYRACPTVVSAPGTIRWSPTYAIGTGGIGIASKLPLRIHVGIEPRADGGVEWGMGRYHAPERDEFISVEPLTVLGLIPRLLEAVAAKHGKPAHARVHMLAELPWYRGLNVDSTIGVALSAAWLLHIGVLSVDEMEAMVQAPSAGIPGMKGFAEFWSLALQIESAFESGIADGDLAAGAFMDGRYPIVFFRERDPVLFDHYRDLGVDHPASYYNVAGGLFVRMARFEELFPLDAFPYLPMDIALVHVGVEGASTTVYKERSATQARLDEVASFIRTHCTRMVPETFREVPKFLELADDAPQQPASIAMYRTYRTQNVAHSMAVFRAMHALFAFGATPSILRDFFHAQNGCQYILCLLDLSNRRIGTARKILRMEGHAHTESGVGVRLVGPGKHGCLLVSGQQQSIERVLDASLPVIEKETGATPHCHYASWCDGAPVGEGLRIHQHLAVGRTSAYVEGSAVAVRVHEHGKTTGVVLCTHERWARERATYDLSLDPHENRIHVRGKALDSRELHTTKQTIELLRCLLANGKQEFSADELPPSPYREDRNQMESKVVRPLKGAMERHTGKPFDLRVTGGLGRNYSLMFTPNGHKIAFVERQ